MKSLIIRYRYGYYSPHPANPQFCANCSWKTCFFRPTTPISSSSYPMVLQLTQLVAPSSHMSCQPLKLVPTCSSEQAFSWSVFQQDQVLLSYTSEQLACFQLVLSIFFPSLTILTKEIFACSRLPFPVLVCKLHSCTEQVFLSHTSEQLACFQLVLDFPSFCNPPVPTAFSFLLNYWALIPMQDSGQNNGLPDPTIHSHMPAQSFFFCFDC